MAASNQLTTLANVKAWAGVTTSNDDAQLNRLIAMSSRFILGWVNRPTFFQATSNDCYDGIGQRAQTLRNFPVLSVSSLTVCGQSIPASSGYPNSGYLLDPWDGFPPGQPQQIYLNGYCFPQRAPGSILVSYITGFVIPNEAQTVPVSPYQVTVNAPYGSWGADQGVTYASGTPLVAVKANPTVGQYIAPTATNAFYQFAAADANAAMLISYSYIPFDVEQACIEMVGERYNYKSRIGVVSKSLGGQETMTYSQKDMSDFVSSALMPYRRVIPV